MTDEQGDLAIEIINQRLGNQCRKVTLSETRIGGRVIRQYRVKLRLKVGRVTVVDSSLAGAVHKAILRAEERMKPKQSGWQDIRLCSKITFPEFGYGIPPTIGDTPHVADVIQSQELDAPLIPPVPPQPGE